MKTSKLLAIVLIASQLLGCATTPPQTPNYTASISVGPNAGIQKVALVKVLDPPEIESVDLGYTRGQGAAAGTTIGAISGFHAWANGGECEGWICGVYVLLLPVFVATGALVGGIAGTSGGESADRLKEAEANARARFQSPYLQTQLLDFARNYATDNTDLYFIPVPSADPKNLSEKPDYTALSAEGFDHVFEIELARLSFDRPALSHTPALKVQARARLILVNTGAVLSDSRYKFESEALPLRDWVANGAALLINALENGLQRLAKDIVDENFLLFYPMPPNEPPVEADLDQSNPENWMNQETQTDSLPHYVLKPVHPELQHCFFCEGPFSNRPHRAMGNLEFVEVNSTQPILRWERFPRAYDLINADGQYNQISDVRYDIKVFETGLPSKMKIVLIPAQPVYSVRNIPEPYHKIQNALSPCTDYFWTVRARFKLSGRERVIEWAGAFSEQAPPWKLRRVRKEDKNPLSFLIPDMSPEWFYYPFKTPCE